MKRKALALLVSLALAMGMCVPAFADNETSGTNNSNGSITIDSAVVGQKYSIYQILELESYDAAARAYSYKANSAWKGFVASEGVKDVYLATNSQGYVTWVEGADAAAFAKAAQAYAKANNIRPVQDPVEAAASSTDPDAKTTTVKFENLPLGYYLVDSTLGTICSLDTTNPNVTMKEKNGVPSIEKEVQEDSTGAWGKTNDADISQTVNFKATITVQAGAENYVMHDEMCKGLTLDRTSLKVSIGDGAVSSDNYVVSIPGTEEGCTFEVAFKDDYVAGLEAGTEIVVTYSASLNEGAVVGIQGNPNEAVLKYGDKNALSTTPPSETITYTWDLDVLKYANGDESKVLKDAQFVLLNSDKTKVATVVNGKLTGWADAPAAGEASSITWPANTVLTTNDAGKIEIDGLDADTYYLREVKAPAGYNVLDKDVEVVITGATKGEGGTLTYTTVVAKVNNQSGTELPSSGGMGTTFFYVVGGLLVAGAAVLLVVRRRAGSEE